MTTWLVEIRCDERNKLRALAQGHDIDVIRATARAVGTSRFQIQALATEDDEKKLRDAGYEVNRLLDAGARGKLSQAQVGRGDRFKARPATATAAYDPGLGGYLNTEEVESAVASLALTYPALCSQITLPEPTWEGRTSHALRIVAQTSPPRAAVLITGGMHAREWGGSDSCISFATRFLAAVAAGTGLTFGGKIFTAEEVSTIHRYVEIVIFPDVNPDGKHYSQNTNAMWRKNRRPAGGVDLNRNFDFLWASGIGTSASATSETYRGPSAASEPEARNVAFLMSSTPRLSYHLDVHSYGEMLLRSWGDDDVQSSDPAQCFSNPAFDGVRGSTGDVAYREYIPAGDEAMHAALHFQMRDAISAVRGHLYSTGPISSLYPCTGAASDWAYCRHFTSPTERVVHGFGLEFGDWFQPDYATEMVHILDEVGAAITALCSAAATLDTFVMDNGADAGDLPGSAPFWDSPDLWVRNADDGGLVHQSPVRGHDNFVHVRVHNRGAIPSEPVRVKAYLGSYISTEFIYPDDYTNLLGSQVLESIAAGSSAVAKIRWNAADIPPAGSIHPCLLGVAEGGDVLPTGAHVWESNDLCQKNITILEAAAGTLIFLPIVLRRRRGPEPFADVELVADRRLQGMECFLDLRSPRLGPVNLEDLREEPPIRELHFPNGAHVTLAERPAGSTALENPAGVAVRLAPGSSISMTPEGTSHGESLHAARLERVREAGREVLRLPIAKRIRVPLDSEKSAKIALGIRFRGLPPDGAVLDLVQRDGGGARIVGGLRIALRPR